MNEENITDFSLAVLAQPRHRAGHLEKGALVINNCDELCRMVPNVKDFFYLVERRSWWGMNGQKDADIKLMEDLALWGETKRSFPDAILLEFANADFVDTDKFRPLGLITPQYTGIQIAAWQPFKRHDLFIRAAALLPQKRFIKFGHFWETDQAGRGALVTRSWKENVAKFGHFLITGRTEEKVPGITLQKETMRLAKTLGANINFPFQQASGDQNLPNRPDQINAIINSARMGILTSEYEGVNRFKMECLAADLPVLVPEDTSNPTKKHINERTGVFFEPTPEKLAAAIEYVEANYTRFSPREYILKNTGHKKALTKLREALQTLAWRDGSSRQFEDIYFDGRNQSFIWNKEDGCALVKRLIKDSAPSPIR